MEQQNNVPANYMATIVHHIDSIIGLIHEYVPNRHGSIAITRLEEAAMWINVMVNSYPIKEPANDSESQDQELPDLGDAA